MRRVEAGPGRRSRARPGTGPQTKSRPPTAGAACGRDGSRPFRSRRPRDDDGARGIAPDPGDRAAWQVRTQLARIARHDDRSPATGPEPSALGRAKGDDHRPDRAARPCTCRPRRRRSESGGTEAGLRDTTTPSQYTPSGGWRGACCPDRASARCRGRPAASPGPNSPGPDWHSTAHLGDRRTRPARATAIGPLAGGGSDLDGVAGRASSGRRRRQAGDVDVDVDVGFAGRDDAHDAVPGSRTRGSQADRRRPRRALAVDDDETGASTSSSGEIPCSAVAPVASVRHLEDGLDAARTSGHWAGADRSRTRPGRRDGTTPGWWRGGRRVRHGPEPRPSSHATPTETAIPAASGTSHWSGRGAAAASRRCRRAGCGWSSPARSQPVFSRSSKSRRSSSFLGREGPLAAGPSRSGPSISAVPSGIPRWAAVSATRQLPGSGGGQSAAGPGRRAGRTPERASADPAPGPARRPGRPPSRGPARRPGPASFAAVRRRPDDVPPEPRRGPRQAPQQRRGRARRPTAAPPAPRPDASADEPSRRSGPSRTPPPGQARRRAPPNAVAVAAPQAASTGQLASGVDGSSAALPCR